MGLCLSICVTRRVQIETQSNRIMTTLHFQDTPIHNLSLAFVHRGNTIDVALGGRRLAADSNTQLLRTSYAAPARI